ncbi:Cro/CI family transcriptional regulator [Cobetia amphilecti]|uniref:Cro/CI family transcriptional regulator n=2 Tax=Halomonadaceae TaxID=28256 RepID=A0ABT6UMV6_9GAMM|nr:MULTISPECIES: Cro/CI family transcriptional regulator [Cobetia]MBR9756436.1 helix-turn-helix domain-containing protein [Gammaproteobacteria bacterium]MCK8069502.1 helix-turn-helix domain-containing protein [Cobetia sp. 1CM21F]MDI5883184.1 Cro/CI family transcriptional regulator [Cobetia amphilecti]QWN37862.1 helix-turn-helix domain-containing protein [Cobetia sp. 4B]
MSNIYRRLVAHFGNQRKTAEALGVDQGSVSHWVCGTNGMSPAAALRAERLTDGAFLAEHLCPRVFGRDKHTA